MLTGHRGAYKWPPSQDWEQVCVVLCHHSPRQIFLTFGQDPLYSRWQPLSIYVAPPSANSGQFILQASSLLPSTYFQPILLPSEPSHSQVTSSAHPHSALIYHACTSKGVAWPCGSYHFWKKPWNVMENETMETLKWNKVPLGDNRVPLVGKLYLRHDSAHFNVSSFLDLYAHI